MKGDVASLDTVMKGYGAAIGVTLTPLSTYAACCIEQGRDGLRVELPLERIHHLADVRRDGLSCAAVNENILAGGTDVRSTVRQVVGT